MAAAGVPAPPAHSARQEPADARDLDLEPVCAGRTVSLSTRADLAYAASGEVMGVNLDPETIKTAAVGAWVLLVIVGGRWLRRRLLRRKRP
jgi:hypothetical protein